jgi:MFS family permease
VLVLLFVAYVFNFIDRQILAILLQPIKEELGASDTAMGLPTGVAFAVFYTCAGIPIARLADRSVRRSIIAAGLTVWSLLTAASGMVRPSHYPKSANARRTAPNGSFGSARAAASIMSSPGRTPPRRAAMLSKTSRSVV